jgi:hypothetical protein
MPSRSIASYLWILPLLASLAFLWTESAARIRQIRATSAAPESLVASPAIDPSSSTGYADNQRKIVLPAYGIDGLHWVMQTQQMLARDELRVRKVDYDNAPDGREVHWASPFRWWLGSLAWCHHQLSGLPLGICVEEAALYASPLLLAVFLIAATPLIARSLGAGAATVFSLGAVSSGPFYDYFVAGYPDHHGLAAFFALMTVLGVLGAGAGWAGTKNPVLPQSHVLPANPRLGFAISAVAGALGLWVSAAALAPVIIAVSLGSAAAAFFKQAASAPDGQKPDPALWRYWGRCGGAASLLVYLIEYFPGNLGWRLEVNHPLYALAWLGGGELLARWWEGPGFAGLFKTPSARAVSVAALAGVLILPLVILVVPEKTFWVGDPLLWSLHREYIVEFQSILHELKRNGPDAYFIASCIPLIALITVCTLLFRNTATPATKATLVVALVPVLLICLMAATQTRWSGLSQAVLLAALIYGAHRYGTSGDFTLSKTVKTSVLLALAVVPAVALWRTHQVSNMAGSTEREIQRLTLRDLAHWLRARSGADRAVVATSPGVATHLAFHGGLATTGTLYWENRDGLHSTAALFGARSEQEARRLLELHSITHVVFVSWNNFAEGYTRLAHGLARGDALPENTFMLNLSRGKVIAPWLRAVPLHLPSVSALNDKKITVYEVVPAQSLQESVTRSTGYFIDSGELSAAARLAPALQRYPDFLPAQVTLAKFQAHSRDADGFSRTMRRVLEQSAQFSNLALEDRTALVTLLGVYSRDGMARHECENCWVQVGGDERALRKLPPRAIADLLQQSERLGVNVPQKARLLARSLLPPEWLSEL